MNRTLIRRTLPLSILIALASGCATNYRKNIEEYNQQRETSFYQKTMQWIASATPSVDADSAVEPSIPSASKSEAPFDRLLKELFNNDPTIASKIQKLRNPEERTRILSGPLHPLDIQIAVAFSNPAITAAGERWRATLMQYDQASYLDGLLAEYRTFTRYPNVNAGKPVNRQMSQAFAPFPGVTSLKGAMVREQVRAAELDWQRVMREKMVEAGLTFYESQYLNRAETSAQENVSLLENLNAAIEERYRSGSASQAAFIKTQTELERQRNQLKDFQSQQKIAGAKINALLGRPPAAQLGKPSEDREADIAHSAEKIQRYSQTNRQEIAVQQTKIARTEIAIRMGELTNRPSADLGYSRMERGVTPEASVEESTDAYGSKAKTTVRPAYAQTEAYLAEMRERLNAERSTLRQITVDTEAMALSYVEELDAVRRKVSLLDKIALPQSQSTYEIVLSNYQAGSASFLDLLDAERELIRNRLESHEAHKTINQTLVRCANLMGRF